jgi:hypothetical protein
MYEEAPVAIWPSDLFEALVSAEQSGRVLMNALGAEIAPGVKLATSERAIKRDLSRYLLRAYCPAGSC